MLILTPTFVTFAHPFQVDSAREVCLVQFEDDSQFLVLWKDISPGETLQTCSLGQQKLVGDTGWKCLLTLCSLTAALPGEELLCCVCRSETVVPGNRLVSCDKCRHGEGRVPWVCWAAGSPSFKRGLCLLSWPGFPLSPHLSEQGEGAVGWG